MPVYERLDGRLDVVDTRPIQAGQDEAQRAPRYASVKEAAAQGTLDDVAQAICREAVGYPQSEPYIDTMALQGFRDIGGNAGMVPWAGPIDLTPEVRRNEVSWGRLLSVFSPPAKNALRLHRTYVLGQGIPMPTAQDADVAEVIESFWDDPQNYELSAHSGQAETDANWLTTGELFLALFIDDDDGHLQVRSVEPLDVDTVVTDPNDRKRILYYRVRQHRDAFDFRSGQALDDVQSGAPDEYVYYPDWHNTDAERDPYRAQATPKAPGGAVLAAFPLNRQGVRGIPEFCAATPWIHSHKRLLEAQSIMAEAKKKIALIKTVKGGPQAVQSSAGLEQSSIAADLGRLERNPARAPGSTYVKNKGIELEYPELGTGADDAQRDAELHAQMIGAGLGWGTHYLVMSTEFHRLATAVTMELPTLKLCLEGQQRWLDMLRGVIDYALLCAAKKGTIDAPVVRKHGREVVDWKKAAPAPRADDGATAQNDSEPPGAVAQAREAIALALEHEAAACAQDHLPEHAAERRSAAQLVREMEPQDTLAQAQHQGQNQRPEQRAQQARKKRGDYTITMPEILDRDRLPNIQAIEAAAAAGHITPEQAAREVMNTLGFSEVSDEMRAWAEWVNVKAGQIQQEQQQAVDLQHKAMAARSSPGGGAAGGAEPALPGTQGAAAPSGGMSRNPVAREAGAGVTAPPCDDAAGVDVREAAGAGHWVTIEEEGIATHIFIQGGRVTKGPAGLIGAQAGHLPPGPNRTLTHHRRGHEPAGARDHPHYAEHQPPHKPEPLPGKPYARLRDAPQVRREQPDPRPEALTPEQTAAGLTGAQEAVRPPRPHGLDQGARRTDDVVAHAVRHHLDQRARERGGTAGAAAGDDPMELLESLVARGVDQKGGAWAPKDAVFDAQRQLRVAANVAHSAGHMTQAERERVHDLAERATLFVLRHGRTPSRLEAQGLTREYETAQIQQREAAARREGFKDLYHAHLTGRAKARALVPVSLGQASGAGAAPREADRAAIADHLAAALPRHYRALLQAQGASVVLHGATHREVFPAARLPAYYQQHRAAAGRDADVQPAGVYTHTTRQAHLFGPAPDARTARHEVGHAVDAALGRVGRAHPLDAEMARRHHEEDFGRIFEEHKDNHKLWSYMRAHPQELFAEGFAAFHDRAPSSIGAAGDIQWDTHGHGARPVSPHDRLKKDAPSLYAFFKNLPKEMEERLAPQG